jgi:DNA uptake protein ComE-like DNA-binding protein
MIQRSGIRAALITALAILSPLANAQPKPLESIKGCTFIPTEWADGDSFQIQTPDEEKLIVRLYVADCLEIGAMDETDSRRLRDQRRHFGITDVKGDEADPVTFAKQFGTKAKEFTKSQLQRPFTIHTRRHKAPGDGKHIRIYAFVQTADGLDLGTELVKAGLARPSGRSSETIAGISADRYQQQLSDYEDQAEKRDKGIWKHTDWDKLPQERDTQRKEDEEDEAAAGEPLPEDFRLNPNTATVKQLDRLPFIGPKLAEAIINARDEEPFEEAKDLIRVDRIEKKTLAKFEKYLDFTTP